jgi:Ca-activated chloride channel family protein
MALTELKKSKLTRKALVVVSDGGDNNSRYTTHQIDQMAAESDAQIFTILLYDNPKAPEEILGPELLDHLASKSGGVNFTVQKIEEIHQVMTKIGVNLHNQYVLGYYVPDDGRTGQYRKIAVQVLVPPGTPRLQIHARPGYYAP